MKTWITADTHLGHENIIKYCGRPYADCEEMNRDIICRWNSVVGKNDIVWHLGDFGFGSKEQISGWLGDLHGQKRLIKGNHDNHANQWYRDCGFAEIYDHPIIINEFVILSHRPIDIINEDSLFGNIYGHIHNDERYITVTSHTACVSVDRWNYTPILFEKLTDQMMKFESSRRSVSAGHKD